MWVYLMEEVEVEFPVFVPSTCCPQKQVASFPKGLTRENYKTLANVESDSKITLYLLILKYTRVHSGDCESWLQRGGCEFEIRTFSS